MDVDIAKPSVKSVNWAERLRPRAVQVKEETACQRWSSRKRTDMSALIYSDKLTNTLRCTVRDTSSTGAQLHLLPSSERLTVDDIPDTFTLIMTHYKERTDVQCEVVRRLGDRIGVRFTSSFVTREVATRAVAKKR
jgi:hypothetical protein